jgi:hypothetical protein
VEPWQRRLPACACCFSIFSFFCFCLPCVLGEARVKGSHLCRASPRSAHCHPAMTVVRAVNYFFVVRRPWCTTKIFPRACDKKCTTKGLCLAIYLLSCGLCHRRTANTVFPVVWS